MIENRPVSTFVSHAVLLAGIAIVLFPIWITIVAASHDAARLLQVPLPLGLGDQFYDNLKEVEKQYEDMEAFKGFNIIDKLHNPKV